MENRSGLNNKLFLPKYFQKKILIKNENNIAKLNLHFTAAGGITAVQETYIDKWSNLLFLHQLLLEGFPKRFSNVGKNEHDKTLPDVLEP